MANSAIPTAIRIDAPVAARPPKVTLSVSSLVTVSPAGSTPNDDGEVEDLSGIQICLGDLIRCRFSDRFTRCELTGGCPLVSQIAETVHVIPECDISQRHVPGVDGGERVRHGIADCTLTGLLAAFLQLNS